MVFSLLSFKFVSNLICCARSMFYIIANVSVIWRSSSGILMHLKHFVSHSFVVIFQLVLCNLFVNLFDLSSLSRFGRNLLSNLSQSGTK